MNLQTHPSRPSTLLPVLLTLLLAACDIAGPGPLPDASRPDALPSMALPGQTVLFSGLRHVAEGEAILTSDPGDLTVSNIGSSGLDGVCIDYSAAEGGATWFKPIDANQLAISWHPRMRFDGSDIGLSIGFEPDEGGATLSVDGFGANRVDLEILQDGQRIHREYDLYFPVGTMQLSGTLELVGTSLTGTSVAAGVVSATAAAVWNQTITVTCPNGDSFDGDEIRFHVQVDGPMYPAAWEQAVRFTSDSGPAEVTILSSQMIRGDLACTGAPRTILSAEGRGAVSFRGMGNPNATGGWLGTQGDVALPSFLLRGVDVSQPGESFRVEIDGIAAGYKSDPQSLVINLSLGWEAGFRVEVDYPGAASYLTYARCQGALVVAATSPNGQPTDVLAAADGYTGFRLKRVDLDEDRSGIVLRGIATRQGAAPQEVRIRVQPESPAPIDPKGTGFTYDARGNLTDAWEVGPIEDDTSSVALPEISG